VSPGSPRKDEPIDLHGHCPVCNRESVLRLAFRCADSSAEVEKVYDIVDCQICSFRFVHLPPDDDELSAYYERAFETSYGNYVRARELKKAHFRHQLGLVASHLPGADARFLDIGCAAGFLLEVALERGWDATGVELNPRVLEYADPSVRRCIHIARAESLDSSETFDVVSMFDVLEHSSDPRTMLETARSRLNDEGVLIVQLPCIDSLGARTMGRRWYQYGVPSHLSYFDLCTFEKLVHSVGLRLKEVRWTRKVLTVGYLRDQISDQLLAGKLPRLPLGWLGRRQLAIPMGERLLVLERAGLPLS
jgi:2-polyprenyl-3-methyl-5-hydroxy-6-metoxy-1,4-benzoquinol methylase